MASPSVIMKRLTLMDNRIAYLEEKLGERYQEAPVQVVEVNANNHSGIKEPVKEPESIEANEVQEHAKDESVPEEKPKPKKRAPRKKLNGGSK